MRSSRVVLWLLALVFLAILVPSCVRTVDSGRAAVAFALHPTGMRELMAVADAGLLMPPKSTWFEPKLADGLLSHVLD